LADGGYLAAAGEWLTLPVDLGRRRIAPMPGPVLARARRVLTAHAGLPIPEAVGRVVEETRKAKRVTYPGSHPPPFALAALLVQCLINPVVQ
jgi:hypothetical protein